MKKTVAIEMDKTRNLKFGMNAIAGLEEALGKPIATLFSNPEEMKISDLRLLILHGLKWEDKSLDEEAVGDLMDHTIDEHGMDYLTEKMGEAMEVAFGNTALPTKKK